MVFQAPLMPAANSSRTLPSRPRASPRSHGLVRGPHDARTTAFPRSRRRLPGAAADDALGRRVDALGQVLEPAPTPVSLDRRGGDTDARRAQHHRERAWWCLSTAAKPRRTAPHLPLYPCAVQARQHPMHNVSRRLGAPSRMCRVWRWMRAPG